MIKAVKSFNFLWIGGIVAVTLMIYACGGGSSGGGGAGGSTVQGNVSNVAAGLERDRGGAPKQTRIAAGVLDALVAPARAQTAVGGIIVSIAGQSATTNTSGNFTITNVPPGDQTLTFQAGDSTASFTLNVPPNSVIVVQNIVISGSTATPASVNSMGQGNTNDNSSADNDSLDNDSADNDSADNDSADNGSADNGSADNDDDSSGNDNTDGGNENGG